MLSLVNFESDSCLITGDSEDDTRKLGAVLAKVLQPGAIVGLSGDLGAGKTHLVKSIASALDVPGDEVNSPTFTLVQEYAGCIPLRHCDTYRLKHPDEFLDLGLDELFSNDGIALIEWTDRVRHLLPRDVLYITIEVLSPESRQFHMQASGGSSRSIVAQLISIIRGTTPTHREAP